ncbi:MAG: hypothetical protein WCP34_12805 [Pseudomonadota bacterium]
MNIETPQINLKDELVAICAGRCIWCSSHKPHPAYSLCAHSEWHKTGRDGAEGAQHPALVLVKWRAA